MSRSDDLGRLRQYLAKPCDRLHSAYLLFLKGVHNMAFSYKNTKGNSYILHHRQTTLKNGSKQTIYFFAKEAKEGALDEVPAGYEVSESKNGLPVLKKKK